MRNLILCVKWTVFCAFFAPYVAADAIKMAYEIVPSDLAETVIKSGDGAVIGRRVAFFEKSEMTKVTNARTTSYYVNGIKVTEELIEQKRLGGIYFVFLDNFCESPYKSAGLGRYMSAVMGDDNLFLGVSESDEDLILKNLSFQKSFLYRDISFTFNYSHQQHHGGNHPYYSQLDGIIEIDKRINKYKELLSGKVYGKPLHWLYSDRGVVVVMQYGAPAMLGAMFGVWESDRGEKFGYKRGDTVYMSERYHRLMDKGLIVPFNQVADEYDIKFDSIGARVVYERDKDYGYGDMTWSKAEVLKNKEQIYPYLAWRPLGSDGNPINSKSQWERDRNGVPKPDRRGNIPPNAPDSDNNTNPPLLKDCPDMDWYFELFCECLNQKMGGGASSGIDPSMFNSYSAYLNTKIMEKPYDPTIYGRDGSVSPQMVETDIMPTESRIYKKVGNDMVLMNDSIKSIYDPFHPLTTFHLTKTKSNFLQYIATALASTTNHDVTHRAKSAFESVFNIYAVASNSVNLKGDLDNLKKSLKNDTLIVKIDSAYYTQKLYLANPFDHNVPYSSKEKFCVLDKNFKKNGKPFKLFSRPAKCMEYFCQMDHIDWGINHHHLEHLRWYMEWEWDVVFVDEKYEGFKRVVGTIKYKKMFWEHENELVIRSGFVHGGSEVNDFLGMDGMDTLMAYDFMEYDMNSKDYYTDSKDVSERDEDIDKGGGLQDLMLKIAVAEGLNLSMRSLYFVATKTTWGKAAYEGAKRLETSMTKKKAYKIALEIYKGYIFWQKTMDVLADVRDNYNAMVKAWDGLCYSVTDIWEYYKNFDWNKVRLTNLSVLLPEYKFDRINANLNSFHLSLSNTAFSVYGSSFQVDQLTRGNYGPLNPLIHSATGQLISSSAVHEETSAMVDKNTKMLDSLTRKTHKNVSNQAYLSNMTAAAGCLIKQQNLKLESEKIRTLGTILHLIESESRDWVTYAAYMESQVTGLNEAHRLAKQEKSLMPLAAHFSRPNGLFNQQRIKTAEDLFK